MLHLGKTRMKCCFLSEGFSCSFLVPGDGCGDPGQVISARRTGNSFSTGDVVDFRCNTGYIGGGSITCQNNGLWTSRPSCTHDGSIPSVPDGIPDVPGIPGRIPSFHGAVPSVPSAGRNFAYFHPVTADY